MPLRSAAVLRVLGRGFPPPFKYNRVEITPSTLRTDIDSNESLVLAYKSRVVISAIETHTYIHACKWNEWLGNGLSPTGLELRLRSTVMHED